MKFITRAVKVYTYTFACIDADNGTISDIQKIVSGEPMTMRSLRKTGDVEENHVLIKSEQSIEKFSIPIDLFIKTAKEYAEQFSKTEEE